MPLELKSSNVVLADSLNTSPISQVSQGLSISLFQRSMISARKRQSFLSLSLSFSPVGKVNNFRFSTEVHRQSIVAPPRHGDYAWQERHSFSD